MFSRPRQRCEPMPARAFAGRLPRLAFALSGALLATMSCARAQSHRGSFNYASAQQCAADRKISSEFCANAQANAQAEFDEKAPRFPSRDSCERVHGAGRCNLGFGGGGKSGGVFFTPRMQSFAVKVVSERDMSVTPVVGSISVSPRSILRRDTHINPAIATQARHNLQPLREAARPGFGVCGLFCHTVHGIACLRKAM